MASDWQRVKEILANAQELAASKRRDYLDEACRDDPDLRREVDSLLGYEDVEMSVLEPILPGLLSFRGDGGSPLLPWEGQMIGPYKVERKLAEGGMGIVVLAVRQDDFRKKVALKLIRREVLSEHLLSRFHLERQVLASLDHPNIAAIYDGGTTEDGLPYFALEYVDGQRIDQYCAARNLSIRQRLELFREVCSAVQAAHRSLVVHRDLKPSNILVGTDGVPKLIDFGIAKPLGPGIVQERVATAAGTRPMTVEYASPEQVRGEQITTATDVYALGVVLFELLTGEVPHALDGTGIGELERVICEVEPKRPSTVVRGDDPRGLRRRLAGDLDSIVLKALRKDRRDRYSSVEQLSGDIGRHLAGLPVIAREGTLVYRARKFVRRNWRSLVTVTILLVVTISAMVMWQNERVAEGRAREAEKQANILSKLVRNFFTGLTPDEAKNRRFTAVEMLEQAREKVLHDLEDQPALLATNLEIIGRVYQDFALYGKARVDLEESLRLRREHYAEDHPLLARGINNLAGLFYRIGEYRQAEILYLEVLRMRRRLGQKEIDLVKPMSTLATIQMIRGEYVEAEKTYLRSLMIREEAWGREDAEVATTLLGLGTLFYVQSDFEKAEGYLRRALNIRRQLSEPKITKIASAERTLGKMLHAQGKLVEAEELLVKVLEVRRELFGEDHSKVALSKKDLAALRLDQGNLAAAEKLLSEALGILREEEPEGSWRLADAESLWGAWLIAVGRYEEAEPFLQRSHRILEQIRSAEAIYTRDAWRRLSELYSTWNKPPSGAARSRKVA